VAATYAPQALPREGRLICKQKYRRNVLETGHVVVSLNTSITSVTLAFAGSLVTELYHTKLLKGISHGTKNETELSTARNACQTGAHNTSHYLPLINTRTSAWMVRT